MKNPIVHLANLRSARRPRGNRGAILLEVLLAAGLLGVVIACLLTAFQGARRVERELRSGLGELGETQRLVELLRDDLRIAEALALTGAQGSRLVVYPERDDLETYFAYETDPVQVELSRVRFIDGEGESGLILSGRRVEFSLLSPGDLPEEAGVDSLATEPDETQEQTPIVGAPSWARTVRLRLLPASPALDDSLLVREYRIELPLSIPILTPQELSS